MKRTPPPLRFLVLVVGGWMCMRTAVHAPGWWVGEGVAGPIAAVPPPPAPGTPPAADRITADEERPALPHALAAAATGMSAQPIRPGLPPPPPGIASHRPQRTLPDPVPALSAAASIRASHPFDSFVPALVPVPQRFEPAAAASGAHPSRWSGSAWLLLRRDEGRTLAQGGTLGGSQMGLRIGYRLGRDAARPVGIAARLYAPAGDRRAAEAALGLDWRPLARVPVSLVAERREALGPRGRSALALGAHGGVSGARLREGVRLDAYGHAGIVGARSRDLYADGAARVTIPAGGLDVGAGVSGGAQPGAARLDAGPVVSLRLPQARLRVSAEWRFRIAGDARPGSGPALTIGTDF